MKLWQAILLTLAIALVGAFLLPSDAIKLIPFLSAFWAYIDAGNRDIKKYKTFFATNPGYVAIGMFLLWPIYFPWWLSFRYKIMHGQAPLKEESKVDKRSGAWLIIRPILLIVIILIILGIIAASR